MRWDINLSDLTLLQRTPLHKDYICIMDTNPGDMQIGEKVNLN